MWDPKRNFTATWFISHQLAAHGADDASGRLVDAVLASGTVAHEVDSHADSNVDQAQQVSLALRGQVALAD